jgi:hypothetical protein
MSALAELTLWDLPPAPPAHHAAAMDDFSRMIHVVGKPRRKATGKWRFGPNAYKTPTLAERRQPMRERVKDMLRCEKIPFVDVDEAKKALFANAKLQSFHFVAYCKNGPNWLVYCGDPRHETREDMASWQGVFGEGFIAIFAQDRTTGIRFRTLEGAEYKLSDLL